MTQTVSVSAAPDYQASREYCRRVTQQQAKNFYYGLRLLPEPAKSSMFALYAWMRRADDLADDSAHLPLMERQLLLDEFRQLTHQAISTPAADAPESIAVAGAASWPGWAAFADCVARHKIPRHLFDAMIDGQKQDLEFHQPLTDADLREYCYRVAGVVGLASIYIWGFSGGAETEAMAIDRGIAFQLTNILRDVREDAERQRIYFPLDTMRQCGLSAQELMTGGASASFVELMRHHIGHAERLFQQSAGLDQRISAENRSALMAMTAIYHGILRKIAAEPQRVLRGRVRLGKLSKICIALQCWRATKGSSR
jgi:phytoene synthase